MDMLRSEQIAEAGLTDWRKLAQGLHARYLIADFAAGRLEVSLRTVDDVARPDSGSATAARFVVEAGRPVVERA